MYLIVGLGNPEQEYSKTRHNMGFNVINEISKQYGATFTRDLNDSMYKIENIKDYFLTDDRICLYHI